MKTIEMTGQRFGRLIVVAQAESRTFPSGQTKTYWRCVCDCGAVKEVSAQSLRRGDSRSCGCLSADTARARFRDLAGQRFGRLVAVKRGETKSDQSTTWVCLCDCGTEKTIRTSQLVNNDTHSCGCLHDLAAAARRWKGDAISYLGMHDRVRTFRGLARSHRCVDCGEVAKDWSYDGGDPNEKFEVVLGSTLAYSADVSYYSPRCRKCHRRYDAAQRRAAS